MQQGQSLQTYYLTYKWITLYYGRTLWMNTWTNESSKKVIVNITSWTTSNLERSTMVYRSCGLHHPVDPQLQLRLFLKIISQKVANDPCATSIFWTLKVTEHHERNPSTITCIITERQEFDVRQKNVWTAFGIFWAQSMSQTSSNLRKVRDQNLQHMRLMKICQISCDWINHCAFSLWGSTWIHPFQGFRPGRFNVSPPSSYLCGPSQCASCW